MRKWPFILALSWVTITGDTALGQEDCEQTPEGRICRVQQPIAAGTLLDANTQRQLGLVTVNGGCSGTLLNRFWVLTARHCVQVNGQILVNPPTVIPALQAANQVTVTAAWAPGRTGVASRLVELGGTALRDIILVYLGRADLGEVNSQRLLMRWQWGPNIPRWVGQRLNTTDVVTQYGQGLSSFARGGTGGVPVTLGTGAGVYRSARFSPAAIDGTRYRLAMNTSNQVGHGGDSGGPTVLTQNGVAAGVAGVQSTCAASGYAPGAPANPPWPWATGISSCTYVSVEPIVPEILGTIQQQPYCTPQPGCTMAPIIRSVWRP
jgi:hypothetical protein